MPPGGEEEEESRDPSQVEGRQPCTLLCLVSLLPQRELHCSFAGTAQGLSQCPICCPKSVLALTPQEALAKLACP